MGTKRGDGCVGNTGVRARAEPLLGCRAGLGLDAYDREGHLPLSSAHGSSKEQKPSAT